MTQPYTQAIALTRGDDYSATVTFDQAVVGFSEMRFTIRGDWATSETDNDAAAYTTTLAAASTYTALLTIPRQATLELQADHYVYDIQVITNAGKKYTTQRGHLRIDPDVTR